MANLRDIINAATPGSWRSESGVVRVGVGGLNAIAYTATFGLFGKDAGENARYIAAYSPDHALLMEDALEAVLDLVKCPICASRGADGGHATMCPLGHVAAYRKERGLNG